jgi:hypothetical protein
MTSATIALSFAGLLLFTDCLVDGAAAWTVPRIIAFDFSDRLKANRGAATSNINLPM